MKNNPWEIPSEELRATFNPDQLPFKFTSEISPQEDVIGQHRAIRALDFGLHIENLGYNIFVTGVPGTGKSSIVQSMIQRFSQTQERPNDWCYVNHFRDPDRPKVLTLTAGKGRELQRDMDQLISSLKEIFPKVFKGKEYEEQRREQEETFSKASENLTLQLEEKAKRNSFMLKRTQGGMIVVPVVNGKALENHEI